MNTIADLNQILDIGLKACRTAAEVITKARNSQGFDLNFKGKDLVTSADVECDKIIRQHIEAAFPTHTYFSEELSPEIWKSHDFEKPTWIVDPIDGTTNFVMGHLHCAVSLAFAVNSQVQVAIVLAPFLAETFTAIKGQGSFCNGVKIHCRQEVSLQESLIATGFPYERGYTINKTVARIKNILLNCRDIRRNGAASIDTCWVASGKLDGYYEDVKPWDIAAAGLIAREAGAVCGVTQESLNTDFNKKLPPDLMSEGYLVANKSIYKPLKSLLELV